MGHATPERGASRAQVVPSAVRSGAQALLLEEDAELQDESGLFEAMISKIFAERVVPSNSSMKLDEGGMISRGDCSFSCKYDRIASGDADPLKSAPRLCRRTKSAVSEPSSATQRMGLPAKAYSKTLAGTWS